MIGVKNSPISVGGTVGSFSTRFFALALMISIALSTLSSFVPTKNVVFPFFKKPPEVASFVTKNPPSKTKIDTYYIMAHGDLYEYTRKINKVV